MDKREYMKDSIDRLFATWLRLSMVIGAVIFLLLSAVDFVAFRQLFTRFLVYRCSIASFLLLLAFLARKTRHRTVLKMFGIASVAASAATIEAMILSTGGSVSPYAFAMILLAVCALAVPADLMYHVLLEIIVYGTYLIPVILTGKIADSRQFFITNFFMLTIILTVQGINRLFMQGIRRRLGNEFELIAVGDRLRESEETARALINSPVDSVFLIEPGGLILEVNETVVHRTGLSADALIGSSIHELMIPELAKNWGEQIDKVVVLGVSVRFEDEREGRWFDHSLHPITDNHGKVARIAIVSRDITKRKQTEETLHNYQANLEVMVVQRTEELSESEKKYRNLFELAGDAIFVADAETGIIIDANLRAELLLNRDRSEIIGMHQSELHPPEDADRYRELFERSVREESFPSWKVNEDAAVIRKDGQQVPVEINASRLKLGGRSVQVGVFKDVRQRRIQEKALMLLKRAVDAIPLGVTVVDKRGCIIYANRAEAELHGYNLLELIGKPPFIYAPPSKTGETPVRKLLESIDLQKENFTRETENVRKDGSVFPIELTTVPVRDGKGDSIALISVCQDISERKRAEIALEEREKKYRDLYQQFVAVLDVVPEVMILVTADLRMKWINKSSDPDFFSATAEPGVSCCGHFMLCSGAENCLVRETLETGRSLERQVRTNTGRTLDVRVFPVFDEGGAGPVGHALCVISDITEKLRLSAETARARQLASIGELAAGVAHEINNPLNSVINYAQLLMDANGPESESRLLSERIFKEGCRIEAIVKGLLSFARHRPGEKTSCEVALMIEEVLLLLRAALNREGIQVTLQLAPVLPSIRANRQQIEQVLMNLVNNARYALNRKFAERDEDKAIEIRGEVGQGEAGPLIVLSVRDRGCGIPANILPQVMNPFFTTKPPGSGTGLGLSICHGIVQEHGGRIDIRSRENEFTEVTVALPMERSEHGNPG